MVKRGILLFLIGMVYIPSFAQQIEQGKTRIVQSMLSKEIVSNADAVVLDEEGLIEFEFSIDTGFSIVERVKRSIQINTTDGIERATLTIPFYSGKYGKELVEIKEYKIARNENNEQVIIKITKADNKKVDSDFYIKEIKPEGVKVGDIIEYSYIKQRFNIDEIPTWYFQSDLPKLKSRYTVKIPESLTYVISTTGSLELEKKESTTTTVRSIPTSFFGGTPYRFREVVIEYKAQDIPALKAEPYGGNINNSISSIRFDLAQFQYPDSPVVTIPYKEEDVAKDIFKNREFGGELKQVKFLQKNLLKEEWNVLEPKERIATVMRAITERVKWNGEYSYLAKMGIKQAYLNRTGNSADINLMLVTALKGCGIDAEPVVLSTRMNGRSLILFTRFINQVVATVVIDDVRYFLDATDTNSTLRVMPIENLNQEGWIIGDKGSFTKVDMTPKLFSLNQENYILNLGNDGNIKGTISNTKTLYEAYLLKIAGDNDLVTPLRRDIERRSAGTFVKNGVLKTSEEGGISMEFELQKFNFARKEGALMKIRLLEFYKDQMNPFVESTRFLPIDFMYPSMDSYNIKINLPEGYKLQEVPATIAFSNKESGMMFTYVVSENTDGSVEGKFNLRIAKPLLQKELYPVVKKMYEEIHKAVNQELIIVKK
ncbi:MAG: DUF3857 domain-containing protein [Flavobacteriaceae bacterium]|jgi:transglutaminase-like putative cysteine protease|nr:DUF3857 domain-containing protein [Flavobacteriaceae bacterium]